MDYAFISACWVNNVGAFFYLIDWNMRGVRFCLKQILLHGFLGMR